MGHNRPSLSTPAIRRPFFSRVLLAKLNEAGRALEFLSVALDEGYHCHYALVHESIWNRCVPITSSQTS